MDLRRWNVKHVRMVVAAAPAFSPHVRDAAGVGAARGRIDEAAVAELIRRAEAAATADISAPPAELDLDFPDRPTVDFAAAMSGRELAKMDYLAGDRFSPALRARLRSETNRRTIRRPHPHPDCPKERASQGEVALEITPPG